MRRPVIAFRNVLNFIMITFTWEEKELLILSEHLSSPSVFNGIVIAQFFIFCVVLCSKNKTIKKEKKKSKKNQLDINFSAHNACLK